MAENSLRPDLSNNQRRYSFADQFQEIRLILRFAEVTA